MICRAAPAYLRIIAWPAWRASAAILSSSHPAHANSITPRFRRTPVLPRVIRRAAPSSSDQRNPHQSAGRWTELTPASNNSRGSGRLHVQRGAAVTTLANIGSVLIGPFHRSPQHDAPESIALGSRRFKFRPVPSLERFALIAISSPEEMAKPATVVFRQGLAKHTRRKFDLFAFGSVPIQSPKVARKGRQGSGQGCDRGRSCCALLSICGFPRKVTFPPHQHFSGKAAAIDFGGLLQVRPTISGRRKDTLLTCNRPCPPARSLL